MSITYPASLPYNPVKWQVSEPYGTNLESTMQSGRTRQRRTTTVDVAQVALTIEMTAAAFETFVAFVRDTLGRGAASFDMPVWNGRAWPVKRVQIANGGRYTFDRVGRKVWVSLTLRVEGF